ncbi:MAG: PVC-type heme-binding CxxCH protein, partial [Verrucomicrobiota bacterium]
KRPDVPDDPGVTLRGYDFSFDPKKLDLRQETGAVQYGLTFDDEGQRYVCSNSSHCIAIIHSWPWVGLNLPSPKVSIPVDGGSAEVYRTSGVEPWRVVRTRWRVQGAVRGPIEGGGRDSGYFTSASGLGIYRGEALPAEFRGNLFVGDVGSNLVHRKLVEKSADRVRLQARRPDDELKTEFLTSTDNWFRPVICKNGPDGALYIIDMYRETIEHPWSLPENIKKHLDLNSGNDKGRIWRVTPKDWEYPGHYVMADASSERLVGMLGSKNGWARDMAAQLLHARDDLDVLAKSVPGMKSEHARMSGMYGLLASGKLNQQLLEGALKDKSPMVRRHALRAATEVPVPPAAIMPLATDSDPWVRFETALLLTDIGKYHVPTSTLVELANASQGDDWIIAAVVEAATKRGDVAELFQKVWDPAVNKPIYTKLAARAKAGEESAAIAGEIAKLDNLALAVSILKSLRSRPVDVLKPIIDKAKSDDSAAGVWLLGLDKETSSETFWNLVESKP